VQIRAMSSTKALAACALALGAAAAAPFAPAAAGAGVLLTQTTPRAPLASATLTDCVTSVNQEERSATFVGEMSVIPGTAKMAIRIEVEEKAPHEALFRAVLPAPGVGAWRTSEPHVKVFKYVKQVTDLAAPGRYRATVRFRWLNARGALIRRAQRTTHVCTEPPTPRALGA
jgi:hypothetical protein